MGVLDYLNQMTGFRRMHVEKPPRGFKYLCIEDFVLQNGIPFKSCPLTSAELEIVKEAHNQSFLMGADVHGFKQCFANAQMLVMYDQSGQLIYHEGYAQGKAIIPVHHGWVTINNKVVDTTWENETPYVRDFLPDYTVGEFPEGYEYLGVPFPDRKYLKAKMVARKMVGSVIDDWEARFPLLRGKQASVEDLQDALV